MNTTNNICGVNTSFKLLIATPNVGATDGGIETIALGKLITPNKTQNPIHARSPQNIAVLTPLTIRIALIDNHIIETKAPLSFKFPRATYVDSLETIIPTFLNPIKAINNPIHADVAYFMLSGIDFIINYLKPVAEITKNTIPETKTAANAVCHGIYIPIHTRIK